MKGTTTELNFVSFGDPDVTKLNIGSTALTVSSSANPDVGRLTSIERVRNFV